MSEHVASRRGGESVCPLWNCHHHITGIEHTRNGVKPEFDDSRLFLFRIGQVVARTAFQTLFIDLMLILFRKLNIIEQEAMVTCHIHLRYIV